MASTTYMIEVSYRAEDYFANSIREDIESNLTKIMRRFDGSSGLGFGRRDLTFYFDTVKTANNARARLMAKPYFRRKYDIKVGNVTSFDDD